LFGGELDAFASGFLPEKNGRQTKTFHFIAFNGEWWKFILEKERGTGGLPPPQKKKTQILAGRQAHQEVKKGGVSFLPACGFFFPAAGFTFQAGGGGGGQTANKQTTGKLISGLGGSGRFLRIEMGRIAGRTRLSGPRRGAGRGGGGRLAFCSGVFDYPLARDLRGRKAAGTEPYFYLSEIGFFRPTFRAFAGALAGGDRFRDA